MAYKRCRPHQHAVAAIDATRTHILLGRRHGRRLRRVYFMCISVQRAVHRPLVVRVLDGMHADGPRAEPRVARKHLGELVPRPLHDARRAPVDDLCGGPCFQLKLGHDVPLIHSTEWSEQHLTQTTREHELKGA